MYAITVRNERSETQYIDHGLYGVGKILIDIITLFCKYNKFAVKILNRVLHILMQINMSMCTRSS